MKHKEKLAEDYVSSELQLGNPITERLYEKEMVKRAYLAGFEEAKDLALGIVMKANLKWKEPNTLLEDLADIGEKDSG